MGFTRWKSCSINLISFCDKITGLVGDGGAVDIVLIDFSRVFEIVPHKILIDKLLMYGLDGQTAWGTENWLDDQA